MPADQGPKADRHQLVADIESLKAKHAPLPQPRNLAAELPGQAALDIPDHDPIAALTHELGRHVTALQDAVRDRDHYLSMLTHIGDAISPTGERPAEALGTLVDDVQALADRADQTEDERDEARAELEQTHSALIATRQMSIDANNALRQKLLTALGLDDDGTTSLSTYVDRLAAELGTYQTDAENSIRQRDAARAERDEARTTADEMTRERDAARAALDRLDNTMRALLITPAGGRYATGYRQAATDIAAAIASHYTGATDPVAARTARQCADIALHHARDEAGNRFPREPRETDALSEGDRAGAPNHEPQKQAEAVEPRIWSHITDKLPTNHPLAWTPVSCTCGCGEYLHSSTNECAQTWIETGKGPYRLSCWIKAISNGDVLDDEWGITPSQAEPILAVPAGYALTPGQALAINHLIAAARAWREADDTTATGTDRALIAAVDALGTEEVPMGDK